jgi:hypothetical protein
MKRHVLLLGLLYMVGGALSVVAAVSLLVLGLGALSIRAHESMAASEFAAGVTAAAFFAIGLLLALWGGANVAAGRALRALSPRGRLACLALAVLNLFLLPFGTALSVYAVWVLLHPVSRRLLGERVAVAAVSADHK